MAYTVSSRYQPIWDTLKKTNSAKLVAPAVLSRRIIKAVIKRKDVDIAYKLECGEQHKKAKLHYIVEPSVGNTCTIRFWITFIPYYNSIGAY